MKYKRICLVALALLFMLSLLPVAPPVEAAQTLEDFRTYTEVDPNGHITATQYLIDADAINENESAYVYKDKGNQYFNDFIHSMEVRMLSPSEESTFVTVWGVANVINNTYEWPSGFSVKLVAGTPNTHYNVKLSYITGVHGAGYSNDSTLFTMDTWCYLTISRMDTSLICEIYTDSDRQNLNDTLSLTCGVSAYRYIYAVSSWGAGVDYAGYVDVQFFYLLELLRYTLHGPFNEDTGLLDYDGINVSVYFPEGESPDSFLLNGTEDYWYTVRPTAFIFDLGYNETRVYHIYSDSEEIYVITPTQPYYTYSFTIVDYVGATNGYLETLLNINGTDRVVERWGLDVVNNIPFIMSWGVAYQIRLVCDEGSHSWGMFVASTEQSQTLLITSGMFPPSYPGLNVTVNALRINATYLQVNYSDSESLTSWVQITIRYKQSYSWSTAYTQNNTGNSHQLNWYDAEATIDYLARVTAFRDNETLTWSFSLAKPPLTTNPWDQLDSLGEWPFPAKNAFGLGLVLAVFAVFSYWRMPLGCVLGVLTAAFLTLIGWMDMNWNFIALAGAVAIFAGLAKAKREEREI